MKTKEEEMTAEEAKEANKERKKPFQVCLKGKDEVIKGFDDKDSAESDCANRNDRAQNFEIDTRYEVRELEKSFAGK